MTYSEVPNRSTTDKEIFEALKHAAVVLAKWKRLEPYGEPRARHHREAAQALHEELNLKLVDKEGTPLFRPEELAFVIFGAALQTMFVDVFPDMMEKFTKKLEK